MARKLRPDEFEARQRQLPAKNKRNIGGKSIAGSREDLTRTPLGSPPVDYDVRSVFDVRPVGAFDFNIEANTALDSIGLNPPIEMTVPEGFVCVLREVSIWMQPTPPGPLKTNYNWTLTLNGSEFPYNQLNSFGIAVDEEKTFMLADEFNRVGLRIRQGTGGNLFGVTGYARFHGTFVQKTARPMPFEIANPSRTRQDSPLHTSRPLPPPSKTPRVNREQPVSPSHAIAPPSTPMQPPMRPPIAPVKPPPMPQQYSTVEWRGGRLVPRR